MTRLKSTPPAYSRVSVCFAAVIDRLWSLLEYVECWRVHVRCRTCECHCLPVSFCDSEKVLKQDIPGREEVYRELHTHTHARIETNKRTVFDI